MAGTLIVSNLKTDTDNSFIVRSNTGTTLFVANTTGIDVANSFASSSITSDKILTVANTQISGNIISSQIAPSVTLYGNPIVTSGNLTVGGSTSLGTASASGNTTMYQTPGSSFLIMNVNGTLAGARRNWAINPEYDVAGGLSFSVGASEGAAPSTPRLIIKQQGALVLSNGSTSVDGTGITFPGTQNASTDANTLDDYEEGTWTPNVGGNATYSSQNGRYTKIGNIVYLSWDMTITTLGTGSATTISGVPFAPASGGGVNAGTWGYGTGLGTSVVFLSFRLDPGGSSSIFNAILASATTSMASSQNIYTNGTNVNSSLTYRAA